MRDPERRTTRLTEQSARAIPDDSADCTLAKAEALTAAATAWARKGDSDRAREDFDAALQKVASVGAGLAFGKVIVTASIAAAQAESGMVLTVASSASRSAWTIWKWRGIQSSRGARRVLPEWTNPSSMRGFVLAGRTRPFRMPAV